MNEDFNDLIYEFKKINNKGYVKGISNNLTNAAGLTFESLINKRPDSKYLPDYKSIEIKTTQRFSRFPISLFSLTFDGPDDRESSYLQEKYGKNDYTYNDKKELIVNLKIKEKVFVYNKYYFELNIDYIFKKIFINIYDLDYNYIESRGFINFDSLEERINIKLQNLALIFASKKIMDNDLYFRYYQINCYKYKGFNAFVRLIESGDITLVIMLRNGKSDIDYGKNKNKNMIFRIEKTSINKLFDELYSYEN